GWGIELNLLSMVRAVDVFLPRLRAHGTGAHIVNTASVAGLVVLQGTPHGASGVPNGIYSATKHAAVAYCTMLRYELAGERIGVSVLCPGTIATNLRVTS